jgi:hypothetical protein
MKRCLILLVMTSLLLSAACAPKQTGTINPVPTGTSTPPSGGTTETTTGSTVSKRSQVSEDKAQPKKPSPRKTVKPTPPKRPTIDDMLVLGQNEYVIFEGTALKLPARIDTGATTSSLHAEAIQPYERDGEKWIRFVLRDPATGTAVEMESPLIRRIQIKEHNGPPQRRYVVELRIRIDSIECRTPFSLTDRGAFEFPVLIGRSFLHGRAVVDVTREYTTSPLSESHE